MKRPLIGIDVFYHSPDGMVLLEQHGPVFTVSNAPPSPFHYVRLIDVVGLIEELNGEKVEAPLPSNRPEQAAKDLLSGINNGLSGEELLAFARRSLKHNGKDVIY